MMPVTGLQILDLNTIATSDYDMATIEDGLNECHSLWTTADTSTW